jgi:hypothetical protein
MFDSAKTSCPCHCMLYDPTQGINPFPDLPEEEAARAAGQAFIQHQQQGSSSEQEEGSDYEGSPGPASAGGDVGDEEGEEEDEWVELSQEELDLLKWWVRRWHMYM